MVKTGDHLAWVGVAGRPPELGHLRDPLSRTYHEGESKRGEVAEVDEEKLLNRLVCLTDDRVRLARLDLFTKR